MFAEPIEVEVNFWEAVAFDANKARVLSAVSCVAGGGGAGEVYGGGRDRRSLIDNEYWPWAARANNVVRITTQASWEGTH